jgi:SAM-dependent MidA family methyltransferase
MELALYAPSGGYYTRADRIGPTGDFFTAVDAGRAFGRSLARQLVEIDRLAGPFEPFHVVELGAGRGLLARDILDALSGDASLAGRLRYTMADRSARMRDECARRVPEGRVAAPEEVEHGLSGCLLAVELFDALPVHRLRRRGGTLVEIGVDLDGAGHLVEVEMPARAELVAWADRYGAAAVEGVEAEISPALAEQVERIAAVLGHGVALIVDYGYRAEELYGPGRERGTLLAYHRHRCHERYLAHVGEQDLTAHVNFSAVEDHARAAGMSVLGLTTQERFLIANGIVEMFEDQDPQKLQDPQRAKRRLQAMQLIHPFGMGRAFKVLALGKGCPATRLAAFADPFGGRPA